MSTNKQNYQKELDKIIENIQKEGAIPTLFLHSCCAPCSTYVIEYLSNYFYITVFYYNPNIDEYNEYHKRSLEQQKLIANMDVKYPVKFIEGEYDVDRFKKMSKGLENEPEGGKRCLACYAIRLGKTAQHAQSHGFDYFATTLTISPLKNTEKLNEIGKALEVSPGPIYLSSDFKKKNGYKRSTQLSKEHDLYRQDYCGCSYSKRDRLNPSGDDDSHDRGHGDDLHGLELQNSHKTP